MDQPAEPSPSAPAGVAAAPPVAARRGFPRLPLLVGVIGLGAVVTTGTFMKRRLDADRQIEARAIGEDLQQIEAGAADYRARMAHLKWTARNLETSAQSAAEPLKTWARERALRFDAFVAALEQSAGELTFQQTAVEIRELSTRGDVMTARGRLGGLRPLKFPGPAEFLRLQEAHYFRPLAQFSRQNPGHYRAFREFEPEAAEADIAALRRELAAAGTGVVTPQTMLGFELLGAVAPPDDPLVADWTTLVSAPDYFESADPATLARWRATQRAVRASEWPTAVAQMQAILKSKIRIRQPFRAAYARAILRNTPDDTTAARPFMIEAAQAGDVEARAWLSDNDYRQGKYADALPWLEARALAGEAEALPSLLAIYAMTTEAVPRDAAREVGMLERITTGPDAPAEALTLLGRFYESGRAERSPEKAFICYQRAAEKGHPAAWIEAARCHLRGAGTPINFDAARGWAVKAYDAGEREQSVAMLIELMQRAPDRTAAAVQQMFEREFVAAPSGFVDVRLAGESVRQLQTMLAKYFDQKGQFAQAAKFYAKSGSTDAAVVQRRVELTTPHTCDACTGSGKIHTTVACGICSGKGSVLCSMCNGRGFSLKAGAPPCTTCDGSGGVVQDGRAVACSACDGTGRGKGSVTKEPCPTCASGRVPCRTCDSGRIKVTKECLSCRGSGSRALADG